MASGAVQHFCHRDERSLDFMFPGSDSPQNYGPEMLFPVPVTCADKSVSLLLTLSSAGSQSGLSLLECSSWCHCHCPSCPRACCSSVRTPTHSACARAFPSKNSQRGLYAPMARAVEVPVWCSWALLTLFSYSQTSACPSS